MKIFNRRITLMLSLLSGMTLINSCGQVSESNENGIKQALPGRGYCDNTGAPLGLNLRYAPDSSYNNIIGAISSGERVEYLCTADTNNGWQYVRQYLSSGQTKEGYAYEPGLLSCMVPQRVNCSAVTNPYPNPNPNPNPLPVVSCNNPDYSRQWVAHYYNDPQEHIYAGHQYGAYGASSRDLITRECINSSASHLARDWGRGSPDYRVPSDNFTAIFMRYDVELKDINFEVAHDDKIVILLRESSKRNSEAFIRYHHHTYASALYSATLSNNPFDGLGSPVIGKKYDVMVILHDGILEAGIDLRLHAKVTNTVVVNICLNPEKIGRNGQVTDAYDYATLMLPNNSELLSKTMAVPNFVDRNDGTQVYTNIPVVSLVFNYDASQYGQYQTLRVRRGIHGGSTDNGFHFHHDFRIANQEFQVIDLGADFNQDGVFNSLNQPNNSDNGGCNYWMSPAGYDGLKQHNW